MTRIFLSILSFVLFATSIYAQNLETDAIKFGTNNQEGTARFISLGGAMSAVGGDLSTTGYNPSGIAIYKSSVATITPSFYSTKTNAVFNKSSFQNERLKFNISNIGAVFSFKNKKFGVLRNVNLALSYNNLNNFNEKIEFRQFTHKSISHNWVNEANTINGSSNGAVDYDKFSFETVGAYNTWLVNFDSSSLQYISPINASIIQSRIFESKGNKRNFSLALGFNVIDKFYIGGGISLPFINYYSRTTFKEQDSKDFIYSFEDFKMSNEYKNTGGGLNGSIGIIYKPISILRISASFQSKTRLSLTEEYTTDFVTNFDTVEFKNNSSQGKFSYKLSLPWRANFGLALVHKKIGLLSFDYEMIDYKSTRFIFEEDYADIAYDMNAEIRKKYQLAHHFKVGAEAKIKSFRLRAGYNLRTSPLQKAFREGKNDFSSQQFSGGVGFVWKRLAIDLAYRYTLSKQYELGYDGNGIYKNTDAQLLVLSLGLKLGK